MAHQGLSQLVLFQTGLACALLNIVQCERQLVHRNTAFPRKLIEFSFGKSGAVFCVSHLQ